MSADAPLTTTEELKLGDVVQIAVQLTDKTTREPFWWRRFACVVGLGTASRISRHPRIFSALTLKMHPDLREDEREIHLEDPRQVVTKLPEDRWPQGVVAMRMKLIAQGIIQLGDE